MSFIYDILLNFSNNQIMDIYEWEKGDDIFYIRKISLLKIKSNQFKDLIGNNIVLDKLIINELYNKCEIINNKKLKKLPYVALFTDSNNVIAITFNELGKSISKSYLLYDEEAEVLEFSTHVEYTNIDYQVISKNCKELLTRNEISKLEKLKNDVINLFNNNEYDILMYYYYECFNESNNDIIYIYNKLLDIINTKDEEKINIIYQINELIKSKR